MSQTGLTPFDSTIHTTNIWLNEIGDGLGWADRQRAYHALRAVLHALRDRLSVEHAARRVARPLALSCRVGRWASGRRVPPAVGEARRAPLIEAKMFF